jgi:hypothetical protein
MSTFFGLRTGQCYDFVIRCNAVTAGLETYGDRLAYPQLSPKCWSHAITKSYNFATSSYSEKGHPAGSSRVPLSLV